MRAYLQINGSRAKEVWGTVVAELPLTVYVNGQRLVTMLCSPFQVEALVVGHLWMERVIKRVDEIARLEVSEVDGRADVELTGPVAPREASAPRPEPLRSSLRITPGVVSARIAELADASLHYKASRGIHSAALCDEQGLLLVAEDVARRNALDKVKGRALLDGIPTVDRMLVSSGRISSELLLRAARMGVPLVASRTSPTDMAIALAEELNITVCGYVRPDGLNLYAGEALVLERAPVQR
jgi:FdhD protein